MKVAIEQAQERSIETCDPLFGDQLKRQVTWKGQETIGVAPGDTFMLHFKLRAG